MDQVELKTYYRILPQGASSRDIVEVTTRSDDGVMTCTYNVSVDRDVPEGGTIKVSLPDVQSNGDLSALHKMVARGEPIPIPLYVTESPPLPSKGSRGGGSRSINKSRKRKSRKRKSHKRKSRKRKSRR